MKTNLIVIVPIVLIVAILIFTTIKRRLESFLKVRHKHSGHVFSIDQYAHESNLSTWNAEYKIIISMVLLIICVLSNNLYLETFIIFFCTFVVVIVGGLPLGKYTNLLTIPLVFMVAGTIVILIEFSIVLPINALASLKVGSFYIYITQTGLIRVAALWGRAFGAISSMYMMTLTTPSNEIFMVLDKIHCPILLIELMNMMYRFIFTMMETQVEMNNAAQSRLGYKNFRTSLNTFGNIGSNLLIISFKKANDYYNALESRLYNGKLNFLSDEKKVSGLQVFWAIILFIYILYISIFVRG